MGRQSKSILLILAVALSAPAFSQEHLGDPDAVATLESIAAAKANVRLVKTAPKWLNGPEPAIPEAEKALGHHGTVIVQGVLGVDGRFSHLSVSESSKSSALDKLALEAAAGSTFSPSVDANGVALPVFTSMSFSFANYTSDHGVGAAKYGCRQFVLDMDWWKEAHAVQNFRDHKFYTMTRGLSVILRQQKGMSLLDAMKGGESNEAFASRWEQAIEACRAAPGARWADKMKPEGDVALGLERQQSKGR